MVYGSERSCFPSPPQKVLVQLHTLVLPHLTNPLLLSDFLTRAINLGSMLGMLALNGLFVLMTQHGLEYVQFYTRLYGAWASACLPRARGLSETRAQACWSRASSTRGTAASSSSCWTSFCAPRTCQPTWWLRS
jgi:hypothetical protein